MPTTSATIPAAVRNTLNLRLLSVPTQGFVYGIPAMRERHPRGGGLLASSNNLLSEIEPVNSFPFAIFVILKCLLLTPRPNGLNKNQTAPVLSQ